MNNTFKKTLCIICQYLCKHNATPVTDKAMAPGCTTTGLTEGSHCSICNKVFVEQNIIPAKGHIPQSEPMIQPTCRAYGYTEGFRCSSCGIVLVEREMIDIIEHKDDDGDGNCDYGCGYRFWNCTHMCHKTGFMGFIWKIVRVFQKLFKMNPVCECGVAHY